MTGMLTIVSGANIAYGLCTDFNTTATGVTATDYVVVKGPANGGWTASVVSTAADVVRVRMCNVTGAAANPNGFTLSFIAFR